MQGVIERDFAVPMNDGVDAVLATFDWEDGLWIILEQRSLLVMVA